MKNVVREKKREKTFFYVRIFFLRSIVKVRKQDGEEEVEHYKWTQTDNGDEIDRRDDYLIRSNAVVQYRVPVLPREDLDDGHHAVQNSVEVRARDFHIYSIEASVIRAVPRERERAWTREGERARGRGGERERESESERKRKCETVRESARGRLLRERAR